MLIQQTTKELHALKLHGLANALEDQMSNPAALGLSFEERLGLLVDHEVTYRENRRLARLLKMAKLPQPACLEDVDYRPDRGLDKSLMASLGLCTWIPKGINLILTGPTGSGKTWLACAFGHQACRKGLTVLFWRLSRLLEDLMVAHGDGSFNKRIMALDKFDLLILDDFGMANLTPTHRADLLEVIEGRTGQRSTVITGQIPMERWHDYLAPGNPTMADAILDRLVSGSYRLTLQGESMRRLRKRKAPTGQGNELDCSA